MLQLTTPELPIRRRISWIEALSMEELETVFAPSTVLVAVPNTRCTAPVARFAFSRDVISEEAIPTLTHTCATCNRNRALHCGVY